MKKIALMILLLVLASGLVGCPHRHDGDRRDEDRGHDYDRDRHDQDRGHGDEHHEHDSEHR